MLYKWQLLCKQLNFGVLPKVVTKIIMLLVVTEYEISMRVLLKNIILLLSSFSDYTSQTGPIREELKSIHWIWQLRGRSLLTLMRTISIEWWKITTVHLLEKLTV